MTQNMFNFKHVKPTSFSTPSLVRLDGFRTAAAPTKGFVFKPLFTGAKAKGWKDIETVTGKKFGSYEEAVSYINGLKGGSNGKSVGGFVGNLFKGAVDTVVGLGPGLYKLGEAAVKDAAGDGSFTNLRKVGGSIAQSYKDTYGPLAHGNFGEFWDNVYNNPLGPILDAASIVTLGAGAAVKGGKLAAEAGLVSKTGKIANMGKAEALLARSPAAIKAVESATRENAHVYRMTSKNPVIKLRQKVVYKAVTSPKLPKGIGSKLEERRFTGREVHINTRNSKGRMLSTAEGHFDPAILGFEKAQRGHGIAPRHVSVHEQAAANILGLVGSHMTVDEAVRNAERIAKEAGLEAPRDLMNVWRHPETKHELAKAVEAHKAGTENRVLTYRNYMDQVGQVDAVHKGLDLNVVEARKYATLAHLSADSVTTDYIKDQILQRNPSLAGDSEKLQDLHRQITDNVLTRMYVLAKGSGMSIGDFIDQHIADGTIQDVWGQVYKPVDAKHVLSGKAPMNGAVFQKPRNNGEIDPIYIPHKTGQDASFGQSYGAGTKNPASLVKVNRHVVLTMGRIAVGEDLLGHEFAKTLRIRHAMDVRESLERASVEVDGADVSQMLASDYVLVKQVEGKSDEFLTRTSQKQINDAFDSTDESQILPRLKEFFTTTNNPVAAIGPEKAAMRGGKYLMVRKSTANQLLQEYHASGKIIKNFVEKPLNLWKYVVLGLSPRNIVTNVVGNTLMAALFAGGPLGAMRIVGHSALKSMASEKITDAVTLKGRMGISDRFMQQMFPEHWQATFSHGELNIHGKAQHFAFAYRATHRNEISLRQGLFMELIRNNDEVRAFYKAGQHGTSFTRNKWEAAAEKAMQKNPHIRDDLSDRVDDALGNYRDFSQRERALRRVMPFYSWYRHAGRTTKALTQRPTTVAAGAALGRYGAQENQNAFGNVPDFMRAFAPMGTGKDGHQAGINTSGLNPFHALAEMAEGGKALVVDGNAADSTSKLSGFMSPFLVSGVEQLTGKSLLTGAPSKAPYGGHGGFLGGLGARIVAGTPEVRLGAATVDAMDSGPVGLNALTPTGQLKKPHVATLSKDLKTNLFNFGGFPYKDVNVSAAQEWQKTLDQKDTYHLPKPRKKKPKKFTLGAINFGAK